MKIKCDACNESYEANPFFFGAKIDQTTLDPFCLGVSRVYKAYCCSKSICPTCGETIIKQHSYALSEKDIIRLAIRGEIN